MSGLETIVSFWHGPLSWLEKLSIASFVRQGHRFVLYSYAPVADLPVGAEWRDAAEILPESEMVFYKGHGTPAVFADRFRLMLMKKGLGIWADCDVYCIRPIEGLGDYIFSYERPPRADGTGGSINVAVLRVPADAPLLDDLLSVFETENRPLFEPHLPLYRRLEVAGRRLLGQKVGPEFMQYGATGPFALSHYLPKYGLLDKVLPPSVFYPVPYTGIPHLLRTGSSLDRAITPDTRGVHVWRSQLTGRGRTQIALPEPQSALHAACLKLGIDPMDAG